MKQKFYLFLTGIVLASTQLIGEMVTDDVGPQDITTPLENESDGNPFKIQFDADYIWPAHIKNSYGEQTLAFATGEAEINAIYYYDPCHNEAATVALNYQRTNLNWQGNPYFTQKDYDVLTLSLAGITQRLPQWTWRGELDINFANLKYWDFNDYMNYNIMLWGRYEIRDDIGVHIGFIAETGMKMDRVYPILGIDWAYDCNWQLSLVFPMNISLLYKIDSNWSVAIESRFFDQRNRTGPNEYLDEGVWHYQTAGVEFAVNYQLAKWLTASLHAGANYGGRLIVADRHYHHRQRINIQSAPYAGGELAFNF